MESCRSYWKDPNRPPLVIRATHKGGPHNIPMGAGIPHGGKRAKCIFGNYVERYRIDDAGNGAPPRLGVIGGARKLGESPRDLADCARMAGDRSSNAGNHRGNADNTTSNFGRYYLDPAAWKPEELDMEGDWRNIGILHRCKVATGLGSGRQTGSWGLRFPPRVRSNPSVRYEG